MGRRDARAGSSTPPIYCINLAASADRRRRMERRLRHHNLLSRTSFVPAVASADLPPGSGGAERAIFLSHVAALEAFLADEPDGSRGAIVCEDDVLLHDEWHVRLAAVLDNLPRRATLCSSIWASGL